MCQIIKGSIDWQRPIETCKIANPSILQRDECVLDNLKAIQLKEKSWTMSLVFQQVYVTYNENVASSSRNKTKTFHWSKRRLYNFFPTTHQNRATFPRNKWVIFLSSLEPKDTDSTSHTNATRICVIVIFLSIHKTDIPSFRLRGIFRITSKTKYTN